MHVEPIKVVSFPSPDATELLASWAGLTQGVWQCEVTNFEDGLNHALAGLRLNYIEEGGSRCHSFCVCLDIWF